MKFALLLIASILFPMLVSGEEYERGPNGGLMLDVAGVDGRIADFRQHGHHQRI